MRIGVLSDTHVTSFAQLPGRVVRTLAGVDLIIHAGDFVARDVLEGLKRLGELKAVAGNMDSEELKRLLPEKTVLEIEGRRVAIIHGWGAPGGIDERVGGMFDDVDIIVYGHSHRAHNEVKNGVLFFNPGQAMNSFGILTIDREVRGEIIRLENLDIMR
jgi:putative phosphoesterase